jgi:hypothetical protein
LMRDVLFALGDEDAFAAARMILTMRTVSK